MTTGRAVTSEPTEGHLTIELPDDAALVTSDMPIWSQGPLALSPDGRPVVYVSPRGPGTQLMSLMMTDLAPRALSETAGARLPFFSPDGHWVGFFADGKLKKIPLGGGTGVTCGGTGGSWGADGQIVFAPTPSSGLFSVPVSGGTARPVTTLDSSVGGDVHGWPQVLDGRRAVLLTVLA